MILTSMQTPLNYTHLKQNRQSNQEADKTNNGSTLKQELNGLPSGLHQKEEHNKHDQHRNTNKRGNGSGRLCCNNHGIHG